MGDGRRALYASATTELRQLTRAPMLIALTAVEALTFLVLVSIFGLTGSRAPTAVVDNDHGALAASLIAHLQHAHHSFSLRSMSVHQANEQLAHGRLVAIITIPAGFSAAVSSGTTVIVPVQIDNVNADLTDDIERAVPSAVTAFGRDNHFGGVRVTATERDLINHDTAYIPYLVVSALALDALVVAGVLGAVSMTREWERGTIQQWQLAPVASAYLLAGKLAASIIVSTVAVTAAGAAVMFAYGIAPASTPATFGALWLCVIVFSCIGACVGAALRRTLPVAPLFFGLALPLFIDSGALEPERFDGTRIWAVAHLSPVYYAIGILESAAHGLRVTPEPILADVAILSLWGVAGALLASRLAARASGACPS